MAEWLKAHAWRACVAEMLPRVRIPASPPNCAFVRNGRVASGTLRVLFISWRSNGTHELTPPRHHLRIRFGDRPTKTISFHFFCSAPPQTPPPIGEKKDKEIVLSVEFAITKFIIYLLLYYNSLLC